MKKEHQSAGAPADLLKILLVMAYLLLAGLLPVLAQGVGIGTPAPHPSAMLDITSTGKGLLIPRMTEAQISQIAGPATGLLVWQTDGVPGFYYNSGTPQNPKWNMLSTAAENFWRLAGNAGTDASSQFVGTTDAQPLRFRVRNVFSGQLDSGKATLFGYKAGWQATQISTTAFGTEALAAPSDEPANTAFGYRAALKTRSGGYNTAVGAESLFENISGSANTVIGLGAMYYNVSGSRNVAVGAGALSNSDTADDNTAVGYLALENNKADRNTAVGSLALAANTSGFQNTAMGSGALRMNTTGSQNTGFGRGALSSNTTGNENTAVGQSALFYNTEGYNNTAMGDAALFHNTSGLGNTAIGRWALRANTVASENVAIGNYTLSSATTLGGNTAVGHRALEKNTAEGNTALGHDAGKDNTTGTGLTAIGFDALRVNTLGSNNTAIGHKALPKNSTGSTNTAVGGNALQGNTSGSANVAAGYHALYTNTTGLRNVALGHSALYFNSSGEDNVALGYQAGYIVTQGSRNTFLGHDANTNMNTIANATAIGAQSMVSCSNCVVLGSVAGQNNAVSSVNVGIGTTTPGEVLTVNGTNPMVQLQHAGINKGFWQITGGQDVKIGTNIDNDLGSFFIRTNGADRVKVEPNGNVGVGTSSPAVRFQVGANGDGSVARANAWTTFSDERFKADIVPIDHALEKVDQLGGYYYHWKNGEDQNRQTGLLAQEVEKVLPEVVNTDDAGMKSVDYGKMTALLLQAIKEQQAEIKSLMKILDQRARQ